MLAFKNRLLITYLLVLYYKPFVKMESNWHNLTNNELIFTMVWV